MYAGAFTCRLRLNQALDGSQGHIRYGSAIPPALLPWIRTLKGAFVGIPPDLPVLEPAHASAMIRRVRFIADRVTEFAFGASGFPPVFENLALHDVGTCFRCVVHNGENFGRLADRNRACGNLSAWGIHHRYIVDGHAEDLAAELLVGSDVISDARLLTVRSSEDAERSTSISEFLLDGEAGFGRARGGSNAARRGPHLTRLQSIYRNQAKVSHGARGL